MKATFQVLCNSENGIESVMETMRRLGFKNIKTTKKSTVSDIAGVIEIKKEKEVEAISRQLKKKARESGQISIFVH